MISSRDRGDQGKQGVGGIVDTKWQQPYCYQGYVGSRVRGYSEQEPEKSMSLYGAIRV